MRPWILATSLSVLVWSVPAGAAEEFEFDSRLSCACKDVTPEGFKKQNPTRKVVEVKLRITAGLNVKEDSVEHISYDIEFPANLEIADFLPKTELGSELAGPIEASAAQKRLASLQVALEGKASVQYHVASGSATGKTDTEQSSMIASGVQVKFLPPKQVVLSAGTKSRGQVLSYKLRPFNQITLEGEREFACLLKVPAEWQGDCVILRCKGKPKGDEGEVVRNMKIGLYLDGDERAKKRVEEEARKHEPTPEHRRRAFAGTWEGTWKHTVTGEGKLTAVISSKGEFSGTFYDTDGRKIGSFKGNIKADKLTYIQRDDSGEYEGEGVIGIDKQDNLTGTFEHRTRPGKVIGSFTIAMTRK